MQNKESINWDLMMALSMITCLFVVPAYSSTPNPGHNATQVGSGAFYGVAGDVWSFPGSVGIGTAGPESPLHVSSGVSSYGFLHLTNTVSGGEAAISFRSSDQSLEGGWTVGKGVGLTGNSFSFYGNSGTRFTITDNGSVGIGTITPAYNLHVVGDIYASGNISCGGSNCGGIGGNGSGGYWNLSGSSLYPNSTSYNVGIGTVSPGAKLNVYGSSGTVDAVIGYKTALTQLYSGFSGQSKSILEVAGGSSVSSGLVLSKSQATVSNGLVGIVSFVNTAAGVEGTDEMRLAQLSSLTDGEVNSGRLAFFTTNAGIMSERLRIDKSGNVGIGTTAPGAKLTVVQDADGSTPAFRIIGSAGDPTNYYLDIVPNSPSSANVDYLFKVKDFPNSVRDVLAIQGNTGNVGIGTTVPNSKLDVQTSSTGNQGLITISSSAGMSTYPGSNNQMGLQWRDGSSTVGTIGVDWDGANTNMYFGGLYNAGYKTWTDKILTIKGTGNVGIGTTAPAALLHTYNPAGSANHNYLMVENARSDYQAALRLKTGTTNADWIMYIPGTSSNLNFYNAGASAGDRVTITSTGSVGIGTTTPDVALDVNGYTQLGSDAPKIKIKKLTGTTGATVGSVVSVAHGLTLSKIISLMGIVQTGTYAIPPDKTLDANYLYDIWADGTNVNLRLGGTASAAVSKPFTITVIYEE